CCGKLFATNTFSDALLHLTNRLIDLASHLILIHMFLLCFSSPPGTEGSMLTLAAVHPTDLVSCCRRSCSRLSNTRLNSAASSRSFSESVSLATWAATNSQSESSFKAIVEIPIPVEQQLTGSGKTRLSTIAHRDLIDST